jgi:GTP-binding protein Era
MEEIPKKSGKVLLVGRPNVGKSTFLNNLIGQKVAITSPKAQTTRFPIRALLEDPRGTIVFIDTPGIFAKAEDKLSKKINQNTLSTLHENVDAVIYMVDHTRRRDFEEAKVLGIVRQIGKPVVLVINKIDKQEGSYLAQYQFMKEEFTDSYEISALHRAHMTPLLDKLFEIMPDKKFDENLEHVNPYPVMNIDSKTFVSELIREKVFIMMGEEIPYTTTAVVDEIKNRSNNMTFVKARILTTEERYKRMIIGAEGRKIKEIGSYARKEIALAIGKKVYLDVTVEVDPHWQELYG